MPDMRRSIGIVDSGGDEIGFHRGRGKKEINRDGRSRGLRGMEGMKGMKELLVTEVT
jgi:hypothetical protein